MGEKTLASYWRRKKNFGHKIKIFREKEKLPLKLNVNTTNW